MINKIIAYKYKLNSFMSSFPHLLHIRCTSVLYIKFHITELSQRHLQI